MLVSNCLFKSPHLTLTDSFHFLFLSLSLSLILFLSHTHTTHSFFPGTHNHRGLDKYIIILHRRNVYFPSFSPKAHTSAHMTLEVSMAAKWRHKLPKVKMQLATYLLTTHFFELLHFIIQGDLDGVINWITHRQTHKILS